MQVLSTLRTMIGLKKSPIVREESVQLMKIVLKIDEKTVND